MEDDAGDLLAEDELDLADEDIDDDSEGIFDKEDDKKPEQKNERHLFKKGDRVNARGNTGTIASVYYEDPAENCPYESKEGGYFYLHGGPYNAEEELSTEFSDRYSEEEIQEAAEELENEYSVYDWEMIDSPYGDD